MTTLLCHEVAEALRRCEIDKRGGSDQLCFEVSGLSADAGVAALVAEFRQWDRKHLFASFEVGPKFRTAVVDMEAMEDLVRGGVATGRVVAFMDATTLGGCKFDFTKEGPDLFEILVTCWGDREHVAHNLANQLDSGTIFRGN